MNYQNRKSSSALKKGLLLVGFIAIVVLGIALYKVSRAWELKQSEIAVKSSTQQWQTTEYETDTGVEQIYHNGKWYQKRPGLESVLVLGIDKFEEQIDDEDNYRNYQQADFLVLAVADHENKVVNALHINRDTMVDIPMLSLTGDNVGTVFGQVALAHTYGSGKADSCINTVEAVSDFLFGTQIDHYMSLTMDAVAVINDAAGGVTLTVMDDFTDIKPQWREGTEITLSGEDALIYVRTRKDVSDNTNIGRMERQRQYIGELYNQAQKNLMNNDTALIKLLAEISPYMVSDYSTSQMSDLFEKMEGYKVGEIESISGEAVLGEKYMEFYADDLALKEQLVKLLYQPID